MKTAVRTGSIVLASLLAVVVAPRASTRPAEAERIVVANEHASTVQFFDLKTGNVLKNILSVANYKIGLNSGRFLRF